MRTWGRVPATPENSNPNNVEFVIDGEFPNGYVWVEVLQLGLGESPMFGNYGSPAQQSVFTQIFPDYYVTLMQQKFSIYFLALLLAKLPGTDPRYMLSATTNPGATIQNPVPI